MQYMVDSLREGGIPFQVNGNIISLSNGWSIVVGHRLSNLFGYGIYGVFKNGVCKKETISSKSVVNFLSNQEGIFSQSEI